MSDKLSIQDLVVLDVLSAQREPKPVKFWRNTAPKREMLYAEKCDRILLYGPIDAFKDLTIEVDDPDAKVLLGEEAYSHLLMFRLGHLHPHGHDSMACSRFNDYWNKYKERWLIESRALGEIISHLTADTRLIEKICGASETASIQAIARDLVQQKAGDTVLLFGDTKRNSTAITKATEKLALTLGQRSKKGVERIVCLHEDDETAQHIAQGIADSDTNCKMDLDIEFAKMKDLPLFIEKAATVYSTLRNGQYPDTERFLLECWKGRANRNGSLVNLGPYDERVDRQADTWQGEDLDNYIGGERIGQEEWRRTQAYLQSKEQARRLSYVIAGMRMSGISPSKAKVKDSAPDLVAA